MPIARGKDGSGFLCSGAKSPSWLQPGFQLLEGNLQGAGAHRLRELGDQLHLPALFVNRDPAAHQDRKPIFRTEAQQKRLPAEDHNRQLRFPILEREVEVPRGRGAQVGDFTLHPHIGIPLLDVIANLADQTAYRPHAPEIHHGF